jgi:hypothetical protein
MLSKHSVYAPHLLQTYIRTSQEFPNAIARGKTIFDQIKPTIAKIDVDSLTRELLQIGSFAKVKSKSHNFNLEESLV